MGNKYKKNGFRQGANGLQRVIAAVFSILQLLMAIRFILKLLGASDNNAFIKGLYDITQPVVGLFEGIFSTMNTNIAGIHGIFEPATVIAVVIISLIEWAVFKLLFRQTGNRNSRFV